MSKVLTLIFTMHIFGLIKFGVFTEDYYVLFLGYTDSLKSHSCHCFFSKRLSSSKHLVRRSRKHAYFFQFLGGKISAPTETQQTAV